MACLLGRYEVVGEVFYHVLDGLSAVKQFTVFAQAEEKSQKRGKKTKQTNKPKQKQKVVGSFSHKFMYSILLSQSQESDVTGSVTNLIFRNL